MNKKETRAPMPNYLKQIVASKHSAEMTIGTLVVIVLAIIVLVVLALGFGTGWTNLWSKISGYMSPVNVDAVKQACTIACASQAKYDYCCRIREVNFGENKKESMTCNSNNMIKPSDCDLSCDGEICGGVVCKADMVVDASGGEISKGAGGNYDYSICSTKNKCYKLSVKTPCTESDVIKQFPNKLDDNLKPIVSPNVCCGTTTTTTGQPAE